MTQAAGYTDTPDEHQPRHVYLHTIDRREQAAIGSRAAVVIARGRASVIARRVHPVDWTALTPARAPTTAASPESLL